MTAERIAPDTITGTMNVKFRNNGSPLYLPDYGMSRDEFYAFCLSNNELRIERSADGQITIMPPTGSKTGIRNIEVSTEINLWNRRLKLGYAFDSSTGFTLSNGAERSADTAWIRAERWDALSASEQEKFACIDPDFVLEIRSKDQSLPLLRAKMEEFIQCGTRLGWLIDPQNRRTYAYLDTGATLTVLFEETLSGGDVMPELAIRLADFI